MAKVAAAGPLAPSNAFQIGGGPKSTVNTLKRKTPSELRGDLLKRKNVTELVDESPDPVTDSSKTADTVVQIHKKEFFKAPRYADTRLNDLFPVRKNGIRLHSLSQKENSKENHPAERIGSLKASSITSHPASGNQHEHLSGDGFVSSKLFGKNRASQGCNAAEKCSDSSFRSVSELSVGVGNLSALSHIDMDKALKGLVCCEPVTSSTSSGEPLEMISNLKTQTYLSEFSNTGRNTPLDLTLKTAMRVLSSSSVNWFHRLVNSSTFNHNIQLNQDVNISSHPASNTPGSTHCALYSWQYPQFSLPSSVISSLTIVEGDGKMGFLSSRQEAWEDSFRSLYYMYRKKNCSIFYVCTTQFVVMFTACNGPKEAKRRCIAYISQSTRGLRSLLQEHGVCFSMPLLQSKAEEAFVADPEEITENGKLNYCLDPYYTDISDIDNSPQSLLMFAGNQRVHALYDFLLNHRFILISLSGMDVPILYSPVPFKNAALLAPEVRCKEVRRADHMHLQQDSYRAGEAAGGSSPGICYSVEIKGAYLPPWTIGNVCDAIRSDGTKFEASFVTEPSSIGLNIGLDAICKDSNPETMSTTDGVQTKNLLFGMSNVRCVPHLRSGFLKGLKCNVDSYTATVTRV